MTGDLHNGGEVQRHNGEPATGLALLNNEHSQLWELTMGWLARYRHRSRHTYAAYWRDVIGTPTMSVDSWLTWCGRYDIDPLQAKRRHVDVYSNYLESEGLIPATIARKLSSISSWYKYLIHEEVLDRNPVDSERPTVERDISQAVGLSADEAAAFLDAADADGPRTAALMRLLLFNGFRVGSLLNATVGDLGYNAGHRVLTTTWKGGKRRLAPLSPPTIAAVDAYLASRPHAGEQDPLFTTRTGRCLTEPHVFRLVRRLARLAGIPSADQLSPHSLRHTFATSALDAGASLRDVQDAMGHVDPRTTRRYDRARNNLDRHPTYAVAARLAERSSR